MNRGIKKCCLFMVFALVTVSALIISCAPKVVKPEAEMDTPDHHFYTGMRLFDEGKLIDAQLEFDRAIQLAPKFSRAYAGNALVKACQGDSKGAFDVMERAGKYAAQDEEKGFVHVSKIRLYTMGKPDKNWLKDALVEFVSAVKLHPKSSAAYYFMGQAQKAALNFDEAGQMFKQVVDINKEYVKEADREWGLIQKIQRAMPGSVAGEKIALIDRITRADAAALFMEELKIDALYKKRTPKTFDTGFRDPEKAKVTASVQATTPTDIADHPLKADIAGILQIGVRGLEIYPDGAFHPNDFVNRAAYAMMIEDILIKITGDNTLATKFIGTTSPFPDLRSDLPYFNAVMVVTSRGMMEAQELTTGEFAPMNPVPGVDSLLTIRKMKEELKFF